MSFDVVLRDRLANEFDNIQKKKKKSIASITTSKRALAKLLREARELKEQLSAGSVSEIHMEELFEGLNLQLTVNRAQFEDWTSHLYSNLLRPLQNLIEKSKTEGHLLDSDILAVELFGGGVRIPKLQAMLSEYLSSLSPLTLSIGKHIDGDEAAVFGAAYYAAAMNNIPQATPVIIQDSAFIEEEEEQGLDQEQLKSLSDQLQKWDLQDLQRQQSEEAKNQLESYLFETREKVSQSKISKGDQKELLEKFDQVSAFLSEKEMELLSAEEYSMRLEQLKAALLKVLSKPNKREL